MMNERAIATNIVIVARLTIDTSMNFLVAAKEMRTARIAGIRNAHPQAEINNWTTAILIDTTEMWTTSGRG